MSGIGGQMARSVQVLPDAQSRAAAIVQESMAGVMGPGGWCVCVCVCV